MKNLSTIKKLGALALVLVLVALAVFASRSSRSATPRVVEIPASGQQLLADGEASLQEVQREVERRGLYIQGVVDSLAIPLLGKEWRKTHKLAKESGRFVFAELTPEEKAQMQQGGK